jgi:hypothetical protein
MDLGQQNSLPAEAGQARASNATATRAARAALAVHSLSAAVTETSRWLSIVRELGLFSSITPRVGTERASCSISAVPLFGRNGVRRWVRHRWGHLYDDEKLKSGRNYDDLSSFLKRRRRIN